METDGINNIVPRENMTNGAKKLRDIYNKKPDAPLYQTEFGYYCLEKWKIEEGMPDNVPLKELFGFDEPGKYNLSELGWCEAAFYPEFEEKVIEDRGEHEVVQDHAGRHVLYFKDERNGFMPEYLDHPVKNRETWEKNVKWRLNPDTPERYSNIDERMEIARKEAATGKIITQNLIGGYMYLRSLIGPEDIMYKLYDEPDLIHECMETWLNLADTVIAKHQEYVTIDELFIAEDICFNNGSLISPEMMKEFLFPYYKQLISNIKSRQIDKNRHLYFQVDTDGFANPVIPIYQEIGMDVMSPFEVAAGCDVVEIGKKYPDLIMTGGIDKRVLAQGKKAIDKHLDYILPVMKERGGYYPTCDHGVPEEVNYDDYLYYRKKCLEFG